MLLFYLKCDFDHQLSTPRKNGRKNEIGNCVADPWERLR